MAGGVLAEEFDIYYVSGQRANGFETHLLRRMSFKKDFVQAITQLGHLPFATVDEARAHKELLEAQNEERIKKEMEGLPKMVFDLQQVVVT